MSAARWQAEEYLRELIGGYYTTGAEVEQALKVIAAAQVAQAEAAERMVAVAERQAAAAERQALAAERANGIAALAADPYRVIQDKDAEIARLKAELEDCAMQPPVISGMTSQSGGFAVTYEADRSLRNFHLLRREDGSTCLCYTRNSNHHVVYGTVDADKQ